MCSFLNLFCPLNVYWTIHLFVLCCCNVEFVFATCTKRFLNYLEVNTAMTTVLFLWVGCFQILFESLRSVRQSLKWFEESKAIVLKYSVKNLFWKIYQNLRKHLRHFPFQWSLGIKVYPWVSNKREGGPGLETIGKIKWAGEGLILPLNRNKLSNNSVSKLWYNIRIVIRMLYKITKRLKYALILIPKLAR